MYRMSGAGVDLTRDTVFAIIADLTIMGYFYDMRSCEFTHTPQRGRTKIIRLRGIVFRDSNDQIISNTDGNRRSQAARVTLTFEDQKNGNKMERRTHQRTADAVLCPVRRIAALVDRIYRLVPNAGADTPINATFVNRQRGRISSTALRKYLRSTCTAGGGRQTFGFDSTEIGTRSIRSGAAMGLFLMNVPAQKIQMLGRWSSQGFLFYI